MFKKILVTSIGFFLLFMVSQASSAPITVQSVLFDCDGDVLTVGGMFGSSGNCSSPAQSGTSDGSGFITNGDFTILEFETDPSDPIGDGIDEWTRGLFDFQADTSYSDFISLLAEPHGKIFNATLSLVLTPMDNLFLTDQFNLENNAFVGSPQIYDLFNNSLNPLLDNGISKIIELDLLDFYSQQQLENYLGDGRYLMTYGDDAMISGAMIRLTANIPEPGTIALFSVGLLSAFVICRRRDRNI